MDSESRLVVTPRLVLGLGIALFGVALTLDRLHILNADRVLRYWPVGLMLIGGLMIVQGDGRQRVRGFVFAGIGTWLFLYFQGILPTPIWELFWPIILIIIGISMATRPSYYRRRRRHHRTPWGSFPDGPVGRGGPFGEESAGGFGSEAASYSSVPPTTGFQPGASPGGGFGPGAAGYTLGVDNSPHVSIFSIMSGVRRASNATAFRGGDITALMGGARLDLRLATIPPGGEAVLDITTIMGGVEIVVPSTWAVSTPIVPFMGSIEDKRLPPLPVDGKIPMPDAQTPRLVIRGFVMMGSVELKS